VVALPLMSNFTDVDALAAEPGVVVRFVARPEELADADLVVLPGTRGTVRALAWLRRSGLADAVARHAADGRPALGVRGGCRRAFLRTVGAGAGRGGFVPAQDTSCAALREERLDRLGDLIEEHADTEALLRLIEAGPPAGLPFIGPGAPEARHAGASS